MKTKLLLITLSLCASFVIKAQTPPPVQAQTPDSLQVSTFADVMPDFTANGYKSFVEYLAANIKYPENEMKQGLQGTVYISFIVEKDGSVTNVKTERGVANAPGLAIEAMRVISTMPKWTPGMQDGKRVRVRVTQPVKFILDTKKSKKKKK